MLNYINKYGGGLWGIPVDQRPNSPPLVEIGEIVDDFSWTQDHNDDLLGEHCQNQRLQISGLYIANTKPGGFSLEVANTDSNTMMVGVRVMLGSQDMTRVPFNMELFSRTVNITLVRPRWGEFCFTKEKSFQCQNKVSINFAALLKHASQVLTTPSPMDVEKFQEHCHGPT